MSAATKDQMRDAIAVVLGDAMDCTRVWEAWSVGTMSQDDFSVITDDEDRLMEIVDVAWQSRQPEIDAKDQRIKELEVGLRDCIDTMREWAGYASEYFREKHNLKRDVEEFEAILKGKP